MVKRKTKRASRTKIGVAPFDAVYGEYHSHTIDDIPQQVGLPEGPSTVILEYRQPQS